MPKNDMVNLDSVILKERSKTDIDESFIAEYAAKQVSETFNELKVIDKKYDSKYDALETDKKNRYKKHYDELISERKEIYRLLEKSETEEQRKDYLNLYVDLLGRLDALYASAENDDKISKNELIEMQKDEKKKNVGWKIASVAAPIVAIAIWEGIKALAKGGKK